MNKNLKPITLTILLSGSALSFAGSWTISPANSFDVTTGYESVPWANAQFWDENTLSPYIAVKGDSGIGSISYSGEFLTRATWRPAYPGEALPIGTPMLQCSVDAQLFGPSGAGASITDGTNVLLSNVTTNRVWQVVATQFIAPNVVNANGDGTYTASFSLFTFTANSSGAGSNYGTVALRSNINGIVMQ